MINYDNLAVGDEIVIIHHCPKALNSVIEIPAVITKVGDSQKRCIRADSEHQKNQLVYVKDIKNGT